VGELALQVAAELSEIGKGKGVKVESIYGGDSMDRQLEGIRKIVITAINGMCQGGGLNMVLCSDISIASDRATFRGPELLRGIADPFLPARLPGRIGVARTKYFLFSAATIDAVEAERIGLIGKVVPHAELELRSAVLQQIRSPDRRARGRQRDINRHVPPFDIQMFEDSALVGFSEGVKAFLEARQTAARINVCGRARSCGRLRAAHGRPLRDYATECDRSLVRGGGALRGYVGDPLTTVGAGMQIVVAGTGPVGAARGRPVARAARRQDRPPETTGVSRAGSSRTELRLQTAKLRRALAKERPDTLPPIRGRLQQNVEILLEPDALIEREIGALEHRFLGEPRRNRPLGAQGRDQRAHGARQARRRHRVRQQSDAHAFRRADAPAGEQQVEGAQTPDGTRQTLRGAVARQPAFADLREAHGRTRARHL
jgi:hypothetical protein